MKTVISTRFNSVLIASILSMSISYIMTLTDNIVAGQIIGSQAVEAMTLIIPITTLLYFLSFLIADGLAMMISYAQGREDRDEVNNLFGMGIISAVGIGVIMSTIFLLFHEQILSFWEISPELRFFAEEFYFGLILIPTVWFVNIFIYTIFVTEGLENFCVKGAALTFIVNVGLDIILCMKFGVFGVGVATTLGALAGVFLQLYYLLARKTQLHFKFYWHTKKFFQGIVYSFYHAAEILCLSILPVMLSAYVIENFGENHIIVVTVGVNLLSLIISIYTGLVDCLQPMICQYYAEKNFKSLEKTMSVGIKTTIILSLAMSICGIIFANFLPMLFNVQNVSMNEEIAAAMRYLLPFIVFLGITFMYSNHYIYIEKLNFGLLIKSLLFLVFPYFGMIIGGKFSMNGLWLGIGISFLAAFVANYFLVKIRNKNFGMLMLDKNILDKQLSYDINATFDEVMALTKKIDADLKNFGFDEKLRNKIVLFTEEIGLNAAERAKEKMFQIEFSILPEKNFTTFIVRDNGEPYDIVKIAEEKNYSFSEYFIDSVTENLKSRSYLASGDENKFVLRF